jgi:mannose-6-phosphate isomerase-like protein (cupin superfamily)
MSNFLHVAAGEGMCIKTADQTMNVKMTASASDRELTIIEGRIAGGSGPPLHVHAVENEAYYVLEGEFEFICGERSVRGGPGTFVFAPRNVPHRYRNVGTELGRIVFTFTPGGIERFFAEAAGEQARERRAVIAAKYGITMLP